MSPSPDDRSVFLATAATELTRPNDDARFQFGLWLRALDAFMTVGDHVFPDRPTADGKPRDRRSEFQISYAILLKCCELEARESILHQEIEFSRLLRELLTINSTLARAEPLKPIEWRSFSSLASAQLRDSATYRDFERELPRYGEEYLPAKLRSLMVDERLSEMERRDFNRFVPKVGAMLLALDVVGRMLRSDDPMKISLAVFAFIHEEVSDLNTAIGAGLARYDETSEFFGMLDAASYTMSMEIRKAFSEELAAVVATRSATAVFARIESAYGVLNDCFRQILAGFAGICEPGIGVADIFPEFHSKLERSVELRARLFELLKLASRLEKDPQRTEIEELRASLSSFVESDAKSLFYKDQETVERFGDELRLISDTTDLGPVLHRFAAYIETLFGQVGMRAALANHPFEPGA